MILSRRKLIVGAAATLASPYILNPAFATMTPPAHYNPVDFGPLGGSDDTPAIQGAIDAMRTYSPSAGVVELNGGNYRVGAIDFTGINRSTFIGNNAWLYGCNQTVAAPVFDMTSCNGNKISGITPIGQQFQAAARPAINPLCAILLAAGPSNNDCNANYFEGCGSAGWFKSGALSIIGGSDNEFRSSRFQNWDPISPALTLSTNPDWWVTSIFKPVTSGGGNIGENLFDGCEFHGAFLEPAPNCWTIYMRNATSVVFNAGNCAASGIATGPARGHFLFQGQNSNITITGTQFYSDSGAQAYCIFECAGSDSVHDLCLVNPLIYPGAGANLLIGSMTSNFPGYRRL